MHEALSWSNKATSARPHTRKSGVACDQCYKLKERCSRPSVTVNCTRCHRLGITCSSVRPAKAAGRRPGPQKQSLSINSASKQTTTTPPHPTIEITSWVRNSLDLSKSEKDQLMFLFGHPKTLDSYVVGPSFRIAEQRSLVASISAALPLLKDAYLACAGALQLLQVDTATEGETTVSLRHASSAMSILMTLSVSTVHDATLCLTMGTMLALYSYSAVGAGTAAICNYCLGTTAPLLETATDAEINSKQGFLVLLEIMDCVFHRRKPTLRIRPQVASSVDRHLGLCLPLLQYYYDICVINHAVQSNTEMDHSIDVLMSLDELQQILEEWQPSQCGDLIVQYEAAEVVNLVAQAKVYRLCGLLLIHRSRYNFDEQDAQADIWSKEILMELDVAHGLTKRTIRCVTLPFLVAAVELRDHNARLKVLQNLDFYVDQGTTSVVKEAITTFLKRIWFERDFKTTTCWFDSICKPCVVLNSMYGDCFS